MYPGMEYTCADSWASDRERDASSHHFFINPVFSNLVNLWDFFWRGRFEIKRGR